MGFSRVPPHAYLVVSAVLHHLGPAFAVLPSPSLLVALLPGTATVVRVMVLAQLPSLKEKVGVALVVAGVALHRGASILERARRARVPTVRVRRRARPAPRYGPRSR